jgi:hypothetical protein
MKIAFANMVGDVCDAAAARYAPPEAVATQQAAAAAAAAAATAAAASSAAGGQPQATDVDADELLTAAQTVPALREVCDKHAVLGAIGCDKRIGPLCLRPGYGFGGPCFPRDNRAFATVSLGLGVRPLLPCATDAANGEHAAVQARQFRDLRAASYTFRDVAYKPGCPTPLIEESQKLRVASLLANHIAMEMRGGGGGGGGGSGGGGADLQAQPPQVLVADRTAVLDQVRLEFGSRFSYEELD